MHLKNKSLILALGFCILAAWALTLTAEEETSFEVVMIHDGETFELSGEEMEVGEVQQFFTESGKEVLLSRTEEGYSFEIDGKAIDLGLDGEMDFDFDVNAEQDITFHRISGADASQVKILRVDATDGDIDLDSLDFGNLDLEASDLEGLQEILSNVDFQAISGNSAQRLLDSGALDHLDEEDRQRILDVLGEEQNVTIKKIVRIHKDKEDGGSE